MRKKLHGYRVEKLKFQEWTQQQYNQLADLIYSHTYTLLVTYSFSSHAPATARHADSFIKSNTEPLEASTYTTCSPSKSPEIGCNFLFVKLHNAPETLKKSGWKFSQQEKVSMTFVHVQMLPYLFVLIESKCSCNDVILLAIIGVLVLIIILLLVFIIWQRKKGKLFSQISFWQGILWLILLNDALYPFFQELQKRKGTNLIKRIQ